MCFVFGARGGDLRMGVRREGLFLFLRTYCFLRSIRDGIDESQNYIINKTETREFPDERDCPAINQPSPKRPQHRPSPHNLKP